MDKILYLDLTKMIPWFYNGSLNRTLLKVNLILVYS